MSFHKHESVILYFGHNEDIVGIEMLGDNVTNARRMGTESSEGFQLIGYCKSQRRSFERKRYAETCGWGSVFALIGIEKGVEGNGGSVAIDGGEK